MVHFYGTKPNQAVSAFFFSGDVSGLRKITSQQEIQAHFGCLAVDFKPSIQWGAWWDYTTYTGDYNYPIQRDPCKS